METVDLQKLYEQAVDFFELKGGVVMKLTRAAAIDVCQHAAGRDLLIVRIEGGISRAGTFEARLDAIWDGDDPPVSNDRARDNNSRGAEFIRSRDKSYNAFILTDAPLTGWRHRETNSRPVPPSR